MRESGLVRGKSILGVMVLATLLNAGCLVANPKDPDSPQFVNFVLPGWVIETEDGTYAGVYDRVHFQSSEDQDPLNSRRRLNWEKRDRVVVKDRTNVLKDGVVVNAKLKGQFMCGEDFAPTGGPVAPFVGFVRLVDETDPQNPKTYELTGDQAICDGDITDILRRARAPKR